jgi:hypothetical protein
MLRGLPASIVLHASILGLFYTGGVAFGWFSPVSVRTEASEFVEVPIELVTVSEFNNIAPIPVPRVEPEPEVEEAMPEVPEVEEDPLLVDEDILEADVDTAAEQAPEETVPEDVVPDLDAAPEVKEKKKEPEKKPEAPKPDVVKPKVDPLDALLNDAASTFESERQTRTRKDAPQPRAAEKKLQDEYTPPKATPRKGAGDRSGNTARLEMLLYNQIYTCWEGVDDQPGAKDLNVRLKIQLDDNGNLTGKVDLLEPTREPLGRSPMRVAVERARRAVQKCAPYSLPKEEYADWKDINVNLGPRFEDTGTRR